MPGRVSAVRLHHAHDRLCIINVHLEPLLAPDGKRQVLVLRKDFIRDLGSPFHTILAGAFNYDRDRVQLRETFEHRDRWHDRQTENDALDLFADFAEVYQPERTRSGGLETRRSISRLDSTHANVAYDELHLLTSAPTSSFIR